MRSFAVVVVRLGLVIVPVPSVKTVPSTVIGPRAVGITALDGAEAGPVPTALVADPVKLWLGRWVSPLPRAEPAGGLPVTVTGVCAVEPMNGVTVYLVIVLPPLLDGAVQLTVADPLPAVAVTPVGAPGTPGWKSDTSSRYIQVSSGGLAPAWCTLNQSTTLWH